MSIDITQVPELAKVEDEMVAQCKAALSNAGGVLVVKEVGILPGDLRDANTMRELVRAVPSVYVAFLGARPAMDADDVILDSRWGVFLVAGHAQQDKRQRGDKREVGLYHMLQFVAPRLNGHTITDIGTLKLKRVDNLFNLQIDKTGLSMFALSYELKISLPYALDTANLNGFETYHADHSMAPGTDEPAAIDEVTLEQ